MPASGEFHNFAISEITIEDRARVAKGNIEELADSIDRHKLLHPIVVTRGGKLVAGERRLLACKRLGWKEIPVHFLDELDPYELRSVEFEENVRRLDMTWQEEAQLVATYHAHRLERDPDWTLEATGDALGIDEKSVRERIAIIGTSESYPELLKADNFTSARRMLEVKHQRALDNEAASFLQTETPRISDTPESTPAPVINSVVQANFHTWGPAYSGVPFNVIHCDFPYGIYHHESDQGGTDHFETYEDTPEIFWALIGTLGKCIKQGNLVAPNAHLYIWFSMNYYEQLRVELSTIPGMSVNRRPLVWHKTDSTGVCPDVKRMPRQVYETCFLCTLGDRSTNKPLADAFGHPGRKVGASHLSHKPVEVLRHFLGLAVDEYARVLDPTCGSGSALVAAEALGAGFVSGLDMNPEHVEVANSELRRLRLA